MPNTDGTIRFDTNVDTKGLTAYGRKMAEMYKTASREAEAHSRAVAAMEKQMEHQAAAAAREIQKQTSELDKMQAQLDKLNTDTSYQGLIDNANNLRDALSAAREQVRQMESAPGGPMQSTGAYIQYQQAQESVKQLKKEYEAAMAALEKYENSPAFLKKAQQQEDLTAKIERQRQKIDELKSAEETEAGSRANALNEARAAQSQLEQQAGAAQQGFQQTAAAEGALNEVTKNLGGSVAGLASDIARIAAGDYTAIIGLVTKGVTGIASAVKKAGSAVVGFGKKLLSSLGKAIGANGFLQKLEQAFHRIGRAILNTLIFSQVTRMFRSFREAVENVIEKDAELSAGLGRLKGNLTTAFMPIWNIALPAIRQLISALGTAIGYLAQLTSTLFGQTVAASEAAASAFNAQAKASEASGKAADKANDRFLAGFDTIQKLGSGSSSGGGSGSADSEVAFAPDAGTNLIGKIADALKNGDWSEIGAIIGDKISDAFGQAADFLSWDNLRQKIMEIIGNISSFLNGIPWASVFGNLGLAIGNGITTALTAAGTLLSEIDFSSMLGGLATGLNNLSKSINWTQIQNALKAGVQNLVTGINTFIETADTESWGKSLAGLFNTLIVIAKTVVETLNWGQLGKKLSTLIKSTIKNIDGEALGKTLMSLIKGLFKLLLNLDIVGILSSGGGLFFKIFKGMIKEFDVASFLKMLPGLLKQLFVLTNVGVTVLGGFAWEAGKSIGNALGEWAKSIDLWGKIKSAFAVLKTGPVNVFRVAVNAIKDMFNGLPNLLKGAGNKIISFLESMANKVVLSINKIINGYNTISNKAASLFGLSLGTIPNISTISIPRLAQGAVIPANREFMAVLGDQRHGANLEAPESLIRQIVREEAGAAASAETLQVLQAILAAVRSGSRIELNGRELGRAVRRELGNAGRATGTAVIPT